MFRSLTSRKPDYAAEDAAQAQRAALMPRVFQAAGRRGYPPLDAPFFASRIRCVGGESAWRFDVQRWGVLELMAVLEALS